ncbi:hypothetical protein RSOLAG1IB_12201 [Rhizoctonia solani AG-1 IB]|uniref:DUF6818 domain-containing protein n=1 Tax=Thanatephorus cucumeris (strain AG1-IB / isolate 7/3/14) TaxID=1108050 RepID=A0A0B7FM88_THACB|nr:hypothetical protein RSOLAG1IB_12201 [Rhizoctonia solani AG-1 IB]
MPPKSKAPKSPKSVDPLAQLSLAERRTLAAKLRKEAPRTTRSMAVIDTGTDDTLPDAAELASAANKQVVHFSDEDGVEDEVNTDGSMEVGEGDEGEREDEGVGKEADSSKPARKLVRGRKGRVAGSAGYSKAEEWLIVKGMQKYLPRGETGWKKVAQFYNRRVAEKRQRDWELIKSKYNRMLKKKKPTGDGDGSEIHDAVLGIEDLRVAQEHIGDIDDEEWPESDRSVNEALEEPPLKKVRIKIEPNSAPLSAPIPAPATAPAPVPAPVPAPAPAPFRRPKPTPKLALKQQEPDILIVSSTDEDEATAHQTIPAKQKAQSGVKVEPGTTYYAAKAPQLTEVKSSPVKRHKNARALVEDLTNTLKSAAKNDSAEDTGTAKVELFGRNLSLERLNKELAESQERCHQLERQLDNVVMAMTMFGIQVSPADRASGPGLGLALLGFLQARFPAAVAPAAVLTAVSSTVPAAASTAATVATNAAPAVVAPAAPAPSVAVAAPL